MDTSPVTCRTLEDFYHVNANTLEKQYKDVLSGYRTWSEASHADKWLVFPENVGPHLAIDETSLSNGELYTIVTVTVTDVSVALLPLLQERRLRM